LELENRVAIKQPQPQSGDTSALLYGIQFPHFNTLLSFFLPTPGFRPEHRLPEVDEFKVDLSDEFYPDYHGYAEDFLTRNKLEFDAIFLMVHGVSRLEKTGRQKQ
jgi:hypothetical protein